MDNDVNYLKLIGLVSKAKYGDQQSMSSLAELVKDKLFAYIYRLTLKYDLAQDILQETLLEMVESLKHLDRADRFWPWMFRTAMGKVQHHFRDKQDKETMGLSVYERELLDRYASQSHNDGLDEMVRHELSDAMFEAMRQLKITHRNVLVLRCFEQMPYSEIAVLMECSEMRARVLFFRAKMMLRRRLSHHGFSKAYLLAALGLFGLITASAKAASTTSTVTAASLEVGFSAAVIGTLGTKLSIAIAAFIAAATVTFVAKTFVYVLVSICMVLFYFLFICLARLDE